MAQFREATPSERLFYANSVAEGRLIYTEPVEMPYAFVHTESRGPWVEVHRFLLELCGENRTRGQNPGNDDYWPVWVYRNHQWSVCLFFQREDHATAFKLMWC